MNKKLFGLLSLAAILTTVLILAGCSGASASASGTAYPPVTVTPTVTADSVSIPQATIAKDKDVYFEVTFQQGTATYMAYQYNGAIQVRASVCVPCRGRTFTLKGNNLICDTCGTVFSAATGKGVSGVSACQNYPKAAVAFTTGTDGSIIMGKADLLDAFQKTLTPGLP